MRRCISVTLTFGWKILYSRCTREEIIFSLRGLDDTYIENNSSQPRCRGIGVSDAVSAGLSRFEDRASRSGRERRARLGKTAPVGGGRGARALVRRRRF